MFAFKVFAASDLQVVKNVAGVESTLTLTTDYSVALNADQNATPGGTVTLTAGALAVGQKVAISTAVQYTQGTDLTNQGGFYPAVVTAALDKLTILAQQVLAKVNRALVLAATDTGISPALPAAALRVGKFLGFDAGGNPAMLSGTGNDSALRTDLAASGGSALAGHLAAGAGSVARTVQAKLRERVTPEDKGAARDGVTNDYAALVNAIATSSTVQLTGGTYQIGTNLNFGASNIVGQKDSRILGKGLTFDTGAAFYDSKVMHLKLYGNGAGDLENGLSVWHAHRTVFDTVVTENYYQGARFVDSYLVGLINCRIQGNSYGALFERSCNVGFARNCSFGGNTNHGAYVRGSYSFTFSECDFEGNAYGVVLGNLSTIGGDPAFSGAEPRVNRIVNCYFEANTAIDIWLGDQASTDRLRGAIVQGNYFQGGAGTAVGIRVEYTDSARILDNYMPAAYGTTKILLKASSRNTTLRPFPRYDLWSTAEIAIEAGATVSPETVQRGFTSLVLDGSGNGFVDILYRVPYEGGTPPLDVSAYSTTDPGAARPADQRVNVIPTYTDLSAGFRYRVVGGTAGATVNINWSAGRGD